MKERDWERAIGPTSWSMIPSGGRSKLFHSSCKDVTHFGSVTENKPTECYAIMFTLAMQLDTWTHTGRRYYGSGTSDRIASRQLENGVGVCQTLHMHSPDSTTFLHKWLHGCHLKSMTSQQKSDSINQCTLVWKTILHSCQIWSLFETTQPLAYFEEVALTRTRWVVIWDQFLTEWETERITSLQILNITFINHFLSSVLSIICFPNHLSKVSFRRIRITWQVVKALLAHQLHLVFIYVWDFPNSNSSKTVSTYQQLGFLISSPQHVRDNRCTL